MVQRIPEEAGDADDHTATLGDHPARVAEGNLENYCNVVADVLVSAGAAVSNPDYDLEKPYDQQVFITRPNKIVRFDETRMKLDQTARGESKSDMIVRASNDDQGEGLATKSSYTVTAVCGHIGEGKARTPLIFFGSGDFFSHTWTELPS
mmetsp:Transcript_12150/g.34185  ORF Transcript_12150/g.34185 Transcript_12150/m.34185 type:complete len:150 (+) Transcript_12150:505-954(+)